MNSRAHDIKYFRIIERMEIQDGRIANIKDIYISSKLYKKFTGKIHFDVYT